MIRVLTLALLAAPAAAQTPPLSLVLSTLETEPMQVLVIKDGQVIWSGRVHVHPQDCVGVAEMVSRFAEGERVECRRTE